MKLGLPNASTFAGPIDTLTWVLLITSGAVVFFVSGLILFFCIRYRENSPHSRDLNLTGSTFIEWGWTLVPFFIFMSLFAWGAELYYRMHDAPAGAEEIDVVAKQWMWKFQHAAGQREINTLHVPLGKPIVLNMTSQDVIHSFFVPAFRVKQDVLPDRYTKIWFQPTQVGEYHLFCTQYCGTMHADMRGTVIVMPQEKYERWLKDGTTGEVISSASRGLSLFTRLGCVSCHSTPPSERAPDLHGLYGRMEALDNGSDVLADENYIRESIVNPDAKIVKGYSAIMPSFAKQLSEEDLLDLVSFVKSIKENPGAHP